VNADTVLPIVLKETLPAFTGSTKSKMADFKLILAINRLVNELGGHLHRLSLYLSYPATTGQECNNLDQTGISKLGCLIDQRLLWPLAPRLNLIYMPR